MKGKKSGKEKFELIFDKGTYEEWTYENVDSLAISEYYGFLFYGMIKNGKEKKLVLKTVSANKEQSFSALVADKTYFLSTDTNEVGKKTVPFNGLDKYDLTQDDYLTKIEPNTYALVRGETLVEFLKQVVTVIERHRHNPTKTMVTNGFEDYTKLKNLVDSLESDILNKSIRIN